MNTTTRSPLFKDLTDQGLAESISGLQSLLAVAMQTGLNVHRIARDLDIAVAVKRQRIRAGTWAPAPTKPPQGAALSTIRAYDRARSQAYLDRKAGAR